MDPTSRFTEHADAYARFRPGYPGAALEWIASRARLPSGARVADVGAGTGIFSQALVQRGFEVFAIEPNERMRDAAARALEATSARVVAGSGEASGLPSHSVALVSVAQALHWLDVERARSEFRRILVPGGWVAIVYNSRDLESKGFSSAYEEAFARFAPSREAVGHLGTARDFRIAELFADGSFTTHSFRHVQSLDWDGVRGWLASISYAPPAGSPDRADLETALREAFTRHARDGVVAIDYVTTVSVGQLAPG
jgi:SAM-dependent methyltransferase